MASKSYRPKPAAELLGISTATFWRWIKERPDFPKPIRLSARCTVFDGDALIAWRDGQHKDVPKGVPIPKARKTEPKQAHAGRVEAATCSP
jgi:prophage regulatory protein